MESSIIPCIHTVCAFRPISVNVKHVHHKYGVRRSGWVDPLPGNWRYRVTVCTRREAYSSILLNMSAKGEQQQTLEHQFSIFLSRNFWRTTLFWKGQNKRFRVTEIRTIDSGEQRMRSSYSILEAKNYSKQYPVRFRVPETFTFGHGPNTHSWVAHWTSLCAPAAAELRVWQSRPKNNSNFKEFSMFLSEKN